MHELSDAIAQNTLRLTTLKRINSAKDDPSGLVQVSILERELAGAESALEGITRANALLSTADSAAQQMLDQLQEARGLALAAADNTLTSEEVAANQLSLDAIIDSIDAFARTEFASRRLLDGSAGFSTSGVDTSDIRDVQVLKKNTGEDATVSIQVLSQATRATDTFDNSPTLAADATLVVTGSRGSATITLGAGSSTQDITDAFNDVTYLTGITAAVDGSDVDFTSTEYGSKAIIDIDVTDGTFVTDGGNFAQGTDATARVNGQQVTADGTTLNATTAVIALKVELDPSASGTLNTFTVSGKGLQFVVGPSATDTARIGLPRLTSASLGNLTGKLNSLKSGGANSLTSGNAATALQIIDDALADVTQSKALIGSFQKYTLDTAGAVMSSIIENTSAALSSIQDVDIALETALLSNNQLLQETAFQAVTISTLSKNNVLGLLQTVGLGF
ncbi:MAG: flagellin [Planctomycetes bacterium]|nr:flagellin [Planctomycetota bacterium]